MALSHSISGFATPEGRATLVATYRCLRYSRGDMGWFACLQTTFQLVRGTHDAWNRSGSGLDLQDIDPSLDIHIQQPLGFTKGLVIWMEEIINRFYYATFNAFVYAGAAFLLVMIGLLRLAIIQQNTYVILALGLEAFLLMLLFVVMYFTPPDDIGIQNIKLDHDNDEYAEEWRKEMDEIATDFANSSEYMQNNVDALNRIAGAQNELIDLMNQAVRAIEKVATPQPELMKHFQQTNTLMQEFNKSLRRMTEEAQTLRRDEIEILVRRELDRVLAMNVQAVYNVSKSIGQGVTGQTDMRGQNISAHTSSDTSQINTQTDMQV
jgi:hypothetical protein